MIRESPEALPRRSDRLPAESRRFHALDNLRAAMMLLGIVLHASLSYSHMPRSPLWPFKDARATVVADAVMAASGLFRMPVFFLLAGFFAAMLHERRGRAGLLRDRLRRIALPSLVAWVLTFPLVRAGFAYADAMAAGVPPASARAAAVVAFGPGHLLAQAAPIHLWFLEYILIYYALALAAPAVPLLRRTSSRSRRGVFGAASLTAVPLMAAPMGVIPAPLSFAPEPVSLAAYGVVFAFGWAAYGRADALPYLGRRAGVTLILALGLLPIAAMALRLRCQVLPPDAFGPLPPGSESALTSGPFPQLAIAPGSMTALGVGIGAQAVLAGSSALAMWLLVYGMTGLFVRYLDRPIGWVRYLADSSYWLYLAHFPLMVWLPIMLAEVELPPVLKLGLVVAIATASLLAARELGRRGRELVVRRLRRRARGRGGLSARTMTGPASRPSRVRLPHSSAHPAR